MNNNQPDPAKVLTDVEKANTTANTAGLPGSTLLTRQDLSTVITKLTNRNTPLRDKLKRKKGNGLAHAWNLRSALGGLATSPKDAFYAENGLPTETTSSYTQKSAAYKLIGSTKNVSQFLIAAGRSFTDIEAEMMEAGMRDVVQAEEWAIFHGDSTSTNANGVSSFDGLDKQIVTNVIDAGGAALTDTTLIDKAVKEIRYHGGGQNLALYCSYGIQNKINQLLFGDVRVNINAGTDGLGFGVNASYYQSPIGKLPIIGDFFANPGNPYPYNNAGASSPFGNSTSNIYILDLDYLAMVDLDPLHREDLAKIADNVRFMIKEYTVLEVTAEPWMAMIENVSDPA